MPSSVGSRRARRGTPKAGKGACAHVLGLIEMARRIEKEIVVVAPRAEVWKAWSTNEGIRRFFGREGNVGVAPGDPYEIRFDPTDPQSGTPGLRALASRPPSMLAFEWNAPPEWPSVRAIPTWVVIELAEAGRQATLVRLTHLGWREGKDWDDVYAYFQRAWAVVLSRLARSFEGGPIDWSAPHRPPPDVTLDSPDLRGLTAWVGVKRPTRPGFPNDMTPDESDAMNAHVAYITDLRASGRLVLAGPTLDAAYGVSLFFAEDERAATEIIRSDPAVARGVMTATVHPYKGSFGRVASFEELLSRS